MFFLCKFSAAHPWLLDFKSFHEHTDIESNPHSKNCHLKITHYVVHWFTIPSISWIYILYPTRNILNCVPTKYRKNKKCTLPSSILTFIATYVTKSTAVTQQWFNLIGDFFFVNFANLYSIKSCKMCCFCFTITITVILDEIRMLGHASRLY